MSDMTTNTDLKPIYQAKPDMRFATTFISNKYRDFAVKGEVIMDKATGEIFTKRPEDGRVVSFFQNKKYMTQLMMDLRILLNNNGAFRYPNIDDANACYLSTDYDIMCLFDNKDISIVDTDQIIPGTSDVTSLQFNVSLKTNGFFCRLTSRDADKAAIEWLTSQYNAICKNYNGTNVDFLEEERKFGLIEKWEDSNATIKYQVIIKNPNETATYDVVDYVRLNEETCVLFPNIVFDDIYDETESITVKITSILYDKIHFMFNHKDDLGTNFTDGLSKFLYADNNIFVRYCNICSFVDKSEDIKLLGNEFIVVLMDVPYVRRYMMKLNTDGDTNIILSPVRPTDDVWSVNGIWAEQIRDVFKGGKTIDLECEVNLKQLELYLAENDDTEYVNFSSIPNDTDILISEEG